MFRAYGLYSHIRANRLRSAYLLASFVLLLNALLFSLALLYESLGAAPADSFDVIAARAYGDFRTSWPAAVAGALVWFAIAYLWHQKMIDYATGAGGVSRAEAPRLYNALENLCISRGLPMPALKIIETDGLNAFASGIRDGQYSVAVTRGLLNALTDAEVEAVLAHELTHIRNRDVQMMVIATIFAGVFAFVGDLMFRNWNFPFGFSPKRDEGDHRGGDSSGRTLAALVALAVIALSWGASILIHFAISRSREYLADAGAVELTKNPDAMISALRKIERHAAIPAMPSRMWGFFIESPALIPPHGWLSTHPSVDDRIAALVDFAGGMDLPARTFDDALPSSTLPAPATAETSFLPAAGRHPLDPPPSGPWGDPPPPSGPWG